MEVDKLQVKSGSPFRFFIEFVRPLQDTRAEQGLRTLHELSVLPPVQDRQLVLTLDEYGQETAEWIERETGETKSSRDSRIVTANYIQKKIGGACGFFQLEELDSSHGTATPLVVNREMVNSLVEILDDIEGLDETETLKKLSDNSYWTKFPERVSLAMKYLAAADEQGREFSGEETPNAAAQAALEAWFYAVGAAVPELRVPNPDIQIRKFGRRKGYEENPQWLQDLPYKPPEILSSPKGMGDRKDEYIIFVDIRSPELEIRNWGDVTDLYDRFIRRFIGAAIYTETENIPLIGENAETTLAGKIGSVEESTDEDREGRLSLPVYYFEPTQPDSNTLRLPALYRISTN